MPLSAIFTLLRVYWILCGTELIYYWTAAAGDRIKRMNGVTVHCRLRLDDDDDDDDVALDHSGNVTSCSNQCC